MPDYKPPMPPQPTTTKLPRVEVPISVLDAIIAELRAIRSETGAELVAIRSELAELQARGSKHSEGVRALSQTDAKHEAQFAAVMVELGALKRTQAQQGAELAEQTKNIEEIKGAVVGFLTSPKVRAVGRVAFSAAMAYAAARGLKVLP